MNAPGGPLKTFTRSNARTCLLSRLKGQQPMAVHELSIIGHSENALATELSIMARAGLVRGCYRTGKKFKEWSLAPEGQKQAL